MCPLSNRSSKSKNAGNVEFVSGDSLTGMEKQWIRSNLKKYECNSICGRRASGWWEWLFFFIILGL